MTLRALAILLLSIGASIAATPRPVLVVLEQTPWTLMVGADSPKFALYDDGTVIYRSERPTPDQPFVTRKLVDFDSFQKELVQSKLGKLADRYDLSSATDQINTVIWTPAQSVTIYGDWRRPLSLGFNSDPEMKVFALREKKMWESLPNEIRQMLRRIEQERKIQGTAWFPEKIEVTFWPYAYASKDSIPWPSDWPGVDAKDTRKRGEDSFSVYLSADKLGELRQLLNHDKKKSAILVDGKKMDQSYRFPFPGESAWTHRSGPALAGSQASQ